MRTALILILAATPLVACTVATQVKDDAGSYTRQTGDVLVDTGKQIGAAGKSAGQEIGTAAKDAGQAVRDGGKEAKKAVTD